MELADGSGTHVDGSSSLEKKSASNDYQTEMPMFNAPDYVFLNNSHSHPSTNSMRPLMINGHTDQPDGPDGPSTMPNGGLGSENPSIEDDEGIVFSKPTLWGRRTSLEKVLLLGLLVLAVAFAVATILLAAERGVCASAGCVRAASNLLSAVDFAVDPCQDFYQYACGQWIRDHPIPDDMSHFGTFAHVRQRVLQQMRVLLEEKRPDEKSEAIKMTRIAYRGCMNKKKRNKAGTGQLRLALKELGGWSVLDGQTNERPTSLTELLGTVEDRYGSDAFISVYVYADSKNTSRNILYIDQGVLGLGRGSRDYYLNKTAYARQLGAYKRFALNVIEILAKDSNITFNYTHVNASMSRILDLERQLAEIMVPEYERRNHSRMYNIRTIKQVTEAAPLIDWSEYFDIVLPDDVRPYVTNETEVLVPEPGYLYNLTLLFQNSTAETRRTHADYVLWRFVQEWVKYLDSRFEDVRQSFARVMTGQEEKPPKWKECAPQPLGWLPLAAGSLYVRRHFDSKDKAEALQMITNLREAFAELVQELDWMDSATKETAIEKAHHILNHIGYPDFIKNNSQLDDHYEEMGLHVNQSYFDMVREVQDWTQRKELRKLLKPFDKDEFDISPAIVNAFYSPEKNAITFPAGILQPPFFNGDFPKAINYGAMGAVIGHEITHGFDDQGSQFDKDGNLQNWWSKDAYKRFLDRTKCIVAQYSSYKVPGIGMAVNGNLTQGENIADNGGVKEAYRAYRKYIAKIGREEPRLPGFEQFNNNQIFFLSYAHFWCGQKRKEASIQQLLTDEHSPELFRVMGVLSNLREFSDAFHCKPNTPLNPLKTNHSKCVVW